MTNKICISTSADSACSYDQFVLRILYFNLKTRQDDDFTRYQLVAYQPPQVSAFNVVIDATRKQTQGKKCKRIIMEGVLMTIAACFT